MSIISNIINSIKSYNSNLLLKQIKSEIPENHLKMATDNELNDIVEYYKRGKKHIKPNYSKDVRYMRLAREYSTWSKDPSTSIGAVAISKNNDIVLSQGYNGFPRAIKDDYRLYIRELKYKYIAHAEANMIYNATHNGVSLKDSTVYVYGLPVCNDCTNALLQAGVIRIVMCDTKNDQRWNDSFKLTKDKLIEAGIEFSFIDIKDLD